ncbi:FAD-NAD(P)-binding [Micromonospora pallida]|uniref:FAD-NAD(P)-binding n=1 Tax=Micromonospora pallida TaxID=145854 RepID=A0A1C6SK65_9ACTN|nr:FAD/NAD(P)-binding protein [Micromonospora pallida]SCL29950.1 FAD-NAD(P)-binding [Micromonospora pallida]
MTRFIGINPLWTLRPARPAIALIGAGPRGVSLLERIGANLANFPDIDHLDIHVIDDTELGAGRIWRTDQTRQMCMNTLAGAVTLFTDDTVTMAGPVAPGPTLFEWCRLALDTAHPSPSSAIQVADIDPAHRAAFASIAVRPGFVDDYRDELEAITVASHPSRSLYGEYIRWCFERALHTLPERVTVATHLARAVGVREDGGRQLVELSTGAVLACDAVVAATGWMPRDHTDEEHGFLAVLARHSEMTWVRPDNPIDQALEDVPDGATAIVRGLGMGFFDTMTLLTIGRGGRFVDDSLTRAGVRYEPSGREPKMYVTSHRGVPYRAKSLYGSLPPSAPQRYLRSVDWSTIPRPIDFDRQLWPLIVKDAFVDYYETLHRVRPEAFAAPLTTVLATIDTTEGVPSALDAAIAPHVPDATDRFDLPAAMSPVRGAFPNPETFTDRVADYMAEDLTESAKGRDSAIKAGLWSISAARQLANAIGTFGGFDAESRASGFRTLQAFGGMVGSGPPAFRSRQLLALVDAGLVRFIGPAAHVVADDELGLFRAESPAVAGSAVTSPVLIDAWMHAHDVTASADTLTHSLAAAGRMRPFSVRGRDGRRHRTGGFDVDPQTGLLVHPDGTRDTAFHVAGIPLDEVMGDTIISPMPRTDPTTLRETDRVARSALRVAADAATSVRTSRGNRVSPTFNG